MTFHEMLPHLKPWVDSLSRSFPGKYIKPQFAFWEVLHILSLTLLGGCSILINLRLLGVGLSEESASEVERNLGKFLTAGVIGIVASGLLIGSANAGRLYDSNAFTVKMVSLVAGVILTFGASLPVARADGLVSGSARVAGVIGLAVWALGLWIFATSNLISPGVFHLLSAAALVMLIVTRGRTRLVYVGVLLALVLVHQIVTHFVMDPDDIVHLDPVDITFACIYAAWIGGVALFRVFRAQRETEAGPMAKLVALTTIFVWVTAAAAGRWIAFA